MATNLTYGFYNASEYDVTTQSYDREYTAEQLSSIFDGVITDGVYAGIGDQFNVSPSSGFNVIIGTGRAWFEHTWSYNSAPDNSITLSNPVEGRDRIDAVVLQIDASNRTNMFSVISGTPFDPTAYPSGTSTDPVKPKLRNDSEHPERDHCYPLAYIRVRTGSSSIQDTDIENAVGVATYIDETDDNKEKPLCPWVVSVLTSYSAAGLVSQWSAAVLHEIDNLESVISNIQAGTAADLKPIVGYNIYIPVSSWTEYSPMEGTEEVNITALGYVYRAFLTSSSIANVTIGMRPYVTWSLQSIDEAGADILNEYQCAVETINGVATGGVYVYATSIPSNSVLALTVECRSVINSPISYAYIVADYPAETTSVTCTNTDSSMELSSSRTMFNVSNNATSCVVTITAPNGNTTKTATQTVTIPSGSAAGKTYHITMSYSS